MGLIAGKCPTCGANLKISETAKGELKCPFCGGVYLVENAINIVNNEIVHNNNFNGANVIINQTKDDSILANLYVIARRAAENNDCENAAKYYGQIVERDPSSWEANFYSLYYRVVKCKISEIQNAAATIINSEKGVLSLIKENITDDDKQYEAVNEMFVHIIYLGNIMYDSAKEFYMEIDSTIRSRFIQDLINRWKGARNICYKFGDNVIEVFGDKYGKNIATPSWKAGISMHKKSIPYFAQQADKDVILQYANKVKKYCPSYEIPGDNSILNGCYIATSVYGSYDCPQVWVLRRFRDEKLAKTWHGRLFIKFYYAFSPSMVRYFGENKLFKKVWKKRLDKFVKELQEKGMKDTPYNDKNW